jgi:LacI family transcriptional regulator
VTGRSSIIASSAGLLHSFFAEVAQGMTSVLRKKGFGLVIASSDEDGELEQRGDRSASRAAVSMPSLSRSTQRSTHVFETIEDQQRTLRPDRSKDLD